MIRLLTIALLFPLFAFGQGQPGSVSEVTDWLALLATPAAEAGGGLKQVVEAQQDVIEELAKAVELLLHAQSLIMRQAAGQ